MAVAIEVNAGSRRGYGGLEGGYGNSGDVVVMEVRELRRRASCLESGHRGYRGGHMAWERRNGGY